MLAFQIILVSHTKKLQSLSNVHFGCDNTNKSITRFDAEISNLRKQASIWSNSLAAITAKKVELMELRRDFILFLMEDTIHGRG